MRNDYYSQADQRNHLLTQLPFSSPGHLVPLSPFSSLGQARWTPASPAVAGKVEVLDMWPNSFSPEGEPGSWSLSYTHSALSWGKELGQMPALLFRPHATMIGKDGIK